MGMTVLVLKRSNGDQLDIFHNVLQIDNKWDYDKYLLIFEDNTKNTTIDFKKHYLEIH